MEGVESFLCTGVAQEFVVHRNHGAGNVLHREIYTRRAERIGCAIALVPGRVDRKGKKLQDIRIGSGDRSFLRIGYSQDQECRKRTRNCEGMTETVFHDNRGLGFRLKSWMDLRREVT